MGGTGHNAGVTDAQDSSEALVGIAVLDALDWLAGHGGAAAGGTAAPDPALLSRFLTRELALRLPAGGQGLGQRPGQRPGEARPHEVAWALGDRFEQEGRPDLAAVCRSPRVHQAISVGRWAAAFTGVPARFWQPALAAVERGPRVPARAALSLAAARALLAAVGEDGLRLEGGRLPLATVRALDDRFRWTEEFPWIRVAAGTDVPPLRILQDHLLAQGLLRTEGDVLRRSPLGRDCAADTTLLWSTLVDPAPRWAGRFERDALGALAAAVLRSADFSPGRVAEELTHVLATRWRPTTGRAGAGVFDGAAAVAQAWYQLGVPLGWWDTGRGPADRRPNPLGRAAAVSVLRAVAGGPAGAEPSAASPS